jgi:hypothetical protein
MQNTPSAAELKKKMEEQQYMYWNVSATLTYVDTETLPGKAPELKSWTLSIFHRSTNPLYGGELSKINNRLVYEFMKQYEEAHRDLPVQIVPEVRRMTLLSVSFLGTMTQAQWMMGVEAQEGTQQAPGATKPDAPGSQQG